MGDTYQGGIVFYIDATGTHGLLAAPEDASRSVVWFNGTFIDTGARSLTNGSTNTDLILTAHGHTAQYAARLCRDFRGGGFSDRYLPAKDELNTLYTNKALVGNFADNIYWSSSQYDVSDIWVQDFGTGQQHHDNSSDGANVAVRAVRVY
ncbi:MAG: hypothetical protein WD824_03925 [Cyclobacteriaceae bacterium]